MTTEPEFSLYVYRLERQEGPLYLGMAETWFEPHVPEKYAPMLLKSYEKLSALQFSFGMLVVSQHNERVRKSRHIIDDSELVKILDKICKH